MPVTNEEINKIQEQLEEKFRDCRTEEIDYTNDIQILKSIKFQKRTTEKKVTKKNFKTGQEMKKTITGTVYDVQPKSKDDPTVDLSEKIREKLFNNIKSKHKFK